MNLRKLILLATATAGLSFAFADTAIAGAKATARYKVFEDGDPFKVITYSDGTVRVVQLGMFNDGVGVAVRDRMRRAVIKATGCQMIDEISMMGPIDGRLVCPATGAANGS